MNWATLSLAIGLTACWSTTNHPQRELAEAESDELNAAARECRRTQDESSAACKAFLSQFPAVEDDERAEERDAAEFEARLRELANAQGDNHCRIVAWLEEVGLSARGARRRVVSMVRDRYETRCEAQKEAERNARLAVLQAGPCTRARVAEELELQGDTTAQSRYLAGEEDAVQYVEEGLERCVDGRVSECQQALHDDGLDAARTCWGRNPWPEVPKGLRHQEFATVDQCLLAMTEARGRASSCAGGSLPTDIAVPGCEGALEGSDCHDLTIVSLSACLEAYASSSPACPPLDVTFNEASYRSEVRLEESLIAARSLANPIECRRGTRFAEVAVEEGNIPLATELADQAAEVCASKAERSRLKRVRAGLASLQKKADARKREEARCGAPNIISFSMAIRYGILSHKKAKGCKYDVFATVVNSDGGLVLATTGSNAVLFRTNEEFVDGQLIRGRKAIFERLKKVTLTDGARRTLPMFRLLP